MEDEKKKIAVKGINRTMTVTKVNCLKKNEGGEYEDYGFFIPRKINLKKAIELSLQKGLVFNNMEEKYFKCKMTEEQFFELCEKEEVEEGVTRNRKVMGE